jgi:hypothetical protein
MGGQDMMSNGEMLLTQRCAWLGLQCELLEQRAVPDARPST